jgi:curved DNA-binding protein CbpA
VVCRWYRDLALHFHPDRGGSNEAMQAINEANNRLRRMVGLGPK